MAGPALDPADRIHPRERQLERSVSWSGRERLRGLWYRLRLTVAEINYASRRLFEVQTGLDVTSPPPQPLKRTRA